MAPPPNARAKRGNASKYCCGSGHAHRQDGSPLKAKVNAARHSSASAALAVRMKGSDIIQKSSLFQLSAFSRVPNGLAQRGRAYPFVGHADISDLDRSLDVSSQRSFRPERLAVN